MEKLDFILDSTDKEMQKTLEHLEFSFSKIRAGRTTPSIIQDIAIEYYGEFIPLNQIANITAPDAMTLSIQPFDISLIREIEKVIVNSNLGFSPNNNGERIIIKIPPLTEDRRKELSKQAKLVAENTKISIRNSRKDANGKIKKIKEGSEDLIKIYEDRLQKLTNSYISKTEEYFSKKDSEIMKV